MEPINNPVTQDNGKTAGIISYFSFIGWLIAYFAFHQNNKTSLGSYQLRQTLLLNIISVVIWIFFDVVFAMIFLTTGFLAIYYLIRLLWLGLFVLWIIGLIGAINGEQKPIPLIGDMAQKMFHGI